MDRNDLISREALRNEVDTWGCNDYDKYDFLEAIDNAPTVDFEKLGESLNCQIRATYGSCDDCLLSCPRNELIKLLGLARPQGEWNEWTDERWGGTTIYCPYCRENALKEYRDGLFQQVKSNFCPNCGADMRQNKEPDKQITVEEYMQSLKGDKDE